MFWLVVILTPWVAIPQFFNKTLQRDVHFADSARNCGLTLLLGLYTVAAAVATFIVFPRPTGTPESSYGFLPFAVFFIAFVLPLLPSILVVAFVLAKNEMRANESHARDDDPQG
jgi:hypothetical protein